jgi:nucleoid DNA-binding protein
MTSELELSLDATQTLVGTTDTIRILADWTQTPRTRVHLILDALALLCADQLAKGHRVRLPGIGILDARIKPAREGTCGLNGKPYSTPAHRRVRLRPDRSLTRAVEVVFSDGRSGFSPTEAATDTAP